MEEEGEEEEEEEERESLYIVHSSKRSNWMGGAKKTGPNSSGTGRS